MANEQKAPDAGFVAASLAEIVKQLRLVWRLWVDPRVATWTKLIPPVALAYVISPLDFIPDVVLGLGQLDDLAVILLGLKVFVELCPPEIVQQHLDALRAGSVKQVQHGSPPDQGEVIDGSYRVIKDN
jgi:uncharacterized membrane protein YkvA (DUF1232 family)